MASKAYSRANILARLFNQPLAVTSQTAAVVLGAIGDRFDVSQLFVAAEGRNLSLPQLEELAAAERSKILARGGIDRNAKNFPANQLMFVHKGVAHIAVRGETVAENGIGPMSGFTGYDGIVAQVQSADADPAIKGILLDIDSPGGEVAGLFECASVLMARRGTKPMRALVRNMGCSAAYALACCADEITLHDLGYAGSIGVISMHADFSAALEQDGIKVTLFTAGDHKADANPFEALPADVARDIQAMVEIAHSRFVTHVAAARNLSTDAVIAQQARIYRGEDAKAAGLVDKVMSWQDSMDEFEQQVNGVSSSSAVTAPSGVSSSKGKAMGTNATAPAAEQQPIFTQAQLDEAVATATATAAADATTASANAERARFAALAELDGGSKISADLAAAVADGTSAGDFAIAQAKAAKAKAGSALANARADAFAQGDLPEGGAAAATAMDEDVPVNRGAAYVNKRKAAAAAQ